MICSILLVMLAPWCPVGQSKEYVLGWLSPQTHVRLGWDLTAAAATMAIEQAHRDGILPNDTVR